MQEIVVPSWSSVQKLDDVKKRPPLYPVSRDTGGGRERGSFVHSFSLLLLVETLLLILILLLASLPAPSCHYFNKHVRGQCLSTLVIAVVGYIFARIALSFVEMITSNSINRHYFEDNEGTEG